MSKKSDLNQKIQEIFAPKVNQNLDLNQPECNQMKGSLLKEDPSDRPSNRYASTFVVHQCGYLVVGSAGAYGIPPVVGGGVNGTMDQLTV